MGLPFGLMSASESQWSLTCGQRPEGTASDVVKCCVVSVTLSEHAEVSRLAISALSRH